MNQDANQVDIVLLEYALTDQGLVAYQDQYNVMPGQQISKIPIVENRGADCYVRAKIDGDYQTMIGEDAVIGMPDYWTKESDGYYYYDQVLQENQQVKLFEEVDIPLNLSQDKAHQEFAVNILVEAKAATGSSAPWQSPAAIESSIQWLPPVATGDASFGADCSILFSVLLIFSIIAARYISKLLKMKRWRNQWVKKA